MVSRDHDLTDSSVTSGQSPLPNPRREDSLASIAAEVRGYAKVGGELDRSERDALDELADRAEFLLERLVAIIDWANLALSNPQEYDSHGVRNLDGPVFDLARVAIDSPEGVSDAR